MLMSRERAAELGNEMVRILEAEEYVSPSGETVEISGLLRRAAAGTVAYPPEPALPPAPVGERKTRIDVHNETTLEAASEVKSCQGLAMRGRISQ